MHSKSDKIEIMTGDEADEIMKQPFDSFKNTYQKNWWEGMSLSSIIFSYCIINVKKEILVVVDHIMILLIR